MKVIACLNRPGVDSVGELDQGDRALHDRVGRTERGRRCVLRCWRILGDGGKAEQRAGE
jgi:hypothetical protein